MLPAETAAKIAAAWNTAVSALGVSATYYHAGQSHSVVCGFAHPAHTPELVGDYSEEARIFTIPYSAGLPRPEKFDKVDVAGRTYVLADVFDLHVNNQLLGWRALSQG